MACTFRSRILYRHFSFFPGSNSPYATYSDLKISALLNNILFAMTANYSSSTCNYYIEPLLSIDDLQKKKIRSDHHEIKQNK
jgi:hypothetical protein